MPPASRVHVGTSGWAYTSWKPGFYPPEVSTKKFLAYYAGRVNSVEVNYTFRSLPTPAMLESWLAATGNTFSFSFKAPQRVSHMLRLRNCEEALAEFVAALDPVSRAGRMGMVLLQLPPNFKVDWPRLDTFLAEARAQTPLLRMAVEFRHESWFAEETYAVLRGHEVALCVAESDELETPDVVTAPFTCYRLRKSRYNESKLKAIADKLRERAESGEVFAYFKHEEEPSGALRAVKTLARLGLGRVRPWEKGRMQTTTKSPRPTCGGGEQ